VNYDYSKLEHCIHYQRVMRHLGRTLSPRLTLPLSRRADQFKWHRIA